MANRKISELPASGALTGAELVELVQGGINKQTTTQDIADLGGGGVTSVVPDASETVKGIIEIATQAEANTGTDDVRAVTPLKLANEKGASGGIVGMSGFSIAFKNLANTFTSLFQNAATAVRTYTFPDRSMTVAGTDDFIGVEDIWVDAGFMQPRVTGGCDILRPYEMTTSLFNATGMAFDQTTQEFATFSFVLPRKYNNGTIVFAPVWFAQSGSGTVQWGVSLAAYRNDDAMTAAFGTPQTSDDTLTATNDQCTGPDSSAITPSGTPASNCLIAGTISRNPASDTLNADAILKGIIMRVTVTAGKDA